MRHLLEGTSLKQSVIVDVAKLLGFSAVLLPLALWALQLAVGTARRRGTIVEY
jgi:hypothetical protein